MIGKFFGCIREETRSWRFAAASKVTKDPPRYCRPGIVSVNPARRHALAIASPLVDPGLLDRCLRDILTMNQHVVGTMRTYEMAGRLVLGLEPLR